MERLWSPWRLAYVTGSRSESGCVFCHAARPPAADSLIVHERDGCYVILNLYPYNNGHLMVVPARHVASFGELSTAELHEIVELVQLTERVVQEVYTPDGLNVGVNLGKPAGAGVVGHLHVHVVPRWNGDTNFMTTIGESRVLPEDLASSADRLRPVFARLAR